jgi:endonuclease G
MNAPNLSFLDIYFLDLARAASAAVGRVIRYDSMKGNGFMISDKLFLTNNHIIHDSEVARRSIVEFSYELNQKRCPKPTTKFTFAPDEFLMSSPEKDLDFTIVAVGDRVSGESKICDFGFCPLRGNEDAYSLGEFVNIIQHPGVEFKKIVLRNNRLVAQSDEVMHYYATVISGSSGSPIFNDRFEPIALHHYGSPSRIAFTQDGKPGPTKIAEGIRISAIVKRINSEKYKLNKKQRLLIDTALTCPFSHPSLLNSK